MLASWVNVLDDDKFAGLLKRRMRFLHGAAGLRHATYPDGTEVGNDLHLQLRFKLDLYGNGWRRESKLYDRRFSP